MFWLLCWFVFSIAVVLYCKSWVLLKKWVILERCVVLCCFGFLVVDFLCCVGFVLVLGCETLRALVGGAESAIGGCLRLFGGCIVKLVNGCDSPV
jgi:hypothetical protein